MADILLGKTRTASDAPPSGQWAMTVNGPWRICFRFKDGDAYDVEITNYHKG